MDTLSEYIASILSCKGDSAGRSATMVYQHSMEPFVSVYPSKPITRPSSITLNLH